jgi:N utilization substance protein B
MLSRRHLRIKVLQALYAFFQSDNDRLDLGEKELLKSINKLYEIYIYQISFLIEIAEFAQVRLEENKAKFFPTPDDLDPNTRFVNNKVIRQIAENRDYRKYYDAYKINWVDDIEMIRKIYREILESEDFKLYMSSSNNSFNDDREILIKIIKKQISRSEILQYYYEEKDIHWSDDFHTANLLVMKTLKSLKENQDEYQKLPTLLEDDEFEEKNEDREFVRHLFRKAVIRSDEYGKLIEDKVKNWEMDRIAIMDVILIKMALVELLEFPSIPIKVTLNEYIELAKMYSTPKSKIFVNGVLDKLIFDLREKNLVKKTGRGLLEG